MSIFKKFPKVNILVAGDVMVDKYLYGDVSRISPEAPVPVVKLRKTEFIPGGAANVAANIAGLKGKAYLFGIVGNDYEGKIFPGLLEKSGISGQYITEIPDFQTTIKTRILAHNQQIVRVDEERRDNLSIELEDKIWSKIEKVLKKIDVILISDYNKGFLTKTLLKRLIMYGSESNKTVLVDPKGKDYFKYKGASIITPNKAEVGIVCDTNETERELTSAGNKLMKSLNLKALLITRGEEGMTLLETGKKTLHLNTMARHVYDVTGAGDTVIAVMAMALGAGASYSEAAEIANTAAGLVVEEVGTSIIKLENLETAARR